MDYRQSLIDSGLLNPNPTPPPDTRPTLRLDDWAEHEAARTIAEWSHDGIIARLTGRVAQLVARYRAPH